MYKKHLIVLAALAQASTGASAMCDNCVVGAVVTSAQQLALAMSTAISTATASLEASITASIKGSEAALATTIVESNSLLTDEVINRTVHSNERAKQDGRFQYKDPCSIPAAAQGMGDVMGKTIIAAASIGRGGTRQSTGGGMTTNMQRVLDESAGRVAPKDPGTAAINAAKATCESFAGSGLRGARCETAGFSASNASGYQDADIRAETLVDGPQRDGANMRIRQTIDPNGKDRSVVEAFMRNLNTPLELRELTKAEAQSDNGRRYIALKDTYDARMSMAEHPIRRHIGMITATTDTLPILNQLLQSGQGKFVQAYLDKEYPAWRTNGISRDQLMDLEVQRRYMNMDWQTRMAGATPEEVAREQLQLMAVQNLLVQNIGQEVREIGLVNATGSMAGARAEMNPQLIGQFKTATH